MNTILIQDANALEEEAKKLKDRNLSELMVEQFIFPEVKFVLNYMDSRTIYKCKFIDGTRNFECNAFFDSYGHKIKIGFVMDYSRRHKQLHCEPLHDYDEFALDELMKEQTGMAVLNATYRGKRWQEFVSTICNALIGLVYIIMVHEPSVIDKTTPPEHSQREPSEPKERIIRPKPDGNKTYLFKDIVRYVYHKKQKTKHNITCESWQVRGHYRHYKSGKSAFVHPYTKGSKKEEIKPADKTYII